MLSNELFAHIFYESFNIQHCQSQSIEYFIIPLNPFSIHEVLLKVSSKLRKYLHEAVLHTVKKGNNLKSLYGKRWSWWNRIYAQIHGTFTNYHGKFAIYHLFSSLCSRAAASNEAYMNNSHQKRL